MNNLKSVFISFLPTYASGTFIYAIISLIITGSLPYLWLGLANLFIPLLFILIFLKPKARTSPNLNGPTLIILLLSALAIYYSVETSLIILASITIVGWLLYVYWYSRFGTRDNPKLQKGNTLESFEVLDTNNETINIPSHYGQPLLILFFRGNWCPLCMAQIKEISRKYQEISDAGTKILLISPQPIRHTKSLAKKFKVPFTFLIDKDNRASKKLGIFHSSGTPMGLEVFGYERDTVMPTVIMTDESGKIIFSDLTDNYRVRPEPDTFLKIMRGQPEIA